MNIKRVSGSGDHSGEAASASDSQGRNLEESLNTGDLKEPLLLLTPPLRPSVWPWSRCGTRARLECTSGRVKEKIGRHSFTY